MMFADRVTAGRVLAEQVHRHLEALGGAGRLGRPLILALPRGGVPVAAEVARTVGGDLDLVLARRITVPGEEYGLGAVAEDGPPVFDTRALQRLRLTEADLAHTIAAEQAELARQVREYRGDRPPPAPAGRVVVVIDDGLATGVTARAALRWVRRHGPAYLMLGVPVCSRTARDAVDAYADEVLCVDAPEYFAAVGQCYTDFARLTDADVAQHLATAGVVTH